MRGLEFQDPSLRADVIDTFLTAAEGDASGQKFVSEHASTLVTLMLKNCMLTEMPAPVCVDTIMINHKLTIKSE